MVLRSIKSGYLSAFLVLLGFFIGQFANAQNPVMLTGVVTSGNTGAPVIGAKITVNDLVTYSISGGSYSLPVTPPGTYPVGCVKPGYEDFLSSPVTFQQGAPVSLNILLLESANPPQSMAAALDTVFPPAVHLTWQTPAGLYEIIYDDGTQEDFSVWATSGNMHAVKFTPLSYPVTVTGGSVNIGAAGNYPPGSNPLVPFQVAVYDGSGVNGTPGNAIAGPYDVIPAGLGWVSFSIPVPPAINSGNFYIVMIQGGNAPNAAGISVDKSGTALRSFQRFVSGGSPWLPADGNFMIRAVVKGTGGPADLADIPGGIVNYMVWRLRQGEEMNPYVWTQVGTDTATTMTDNSWMNLPCGPFLWAVKTQYTGNRWSPATFSNVIGKCWTFPVTVSVGLTCEAAPVSGTNVKLKNLVYQDTVYTATLDTTGSVIFPAVWKGTYQAEISRFNYHTRTMTVSVVHDTTLEVVLQQKTAAPSNLTVNEKSLTASWNIPRVTNELFNESWAGGNFSGNGWTIEGGLNWVVSQTDGKPSPSAMFDWMPHVYDYNQSLISRTISGNNSTLLKLTYDIMLDNFSSTKLNQMSVELWNGSEWIPLRTYDNTKGSIPWTQEIVDISTYSNLTFRLRFRASGADSYDINRWNIDNIKVIEEESAANLSDCILGYYFLINNAIAAFVEDTTCFVPPGLVQYGQSYLACVQAVYASGNSTAVCSPFTSRYLIPPSGLTGTEIENAIYLTWNQPIALKSKGTDGNPPPGLTGYYIYRNGSRIDSVLNPDILLYYDFSLDPGTYSYGVSAKYDLTGYGYPGDTDESVQDGPAIVELDYGLLLPFTEPWDNGNFSYNDWSFSETQGNWRITAVDGNPAPAAEFYFEPQQTNYGFRLESPVITAMDVMCAQVWLDFDYMLILSQPTGTEKILISLYFNNKWHLLDSIANTGSYPWVSGHHNLNIVRGKAFKIGFTAKGLNTENIIAWRLDNIHVYSVCNPALEPAADPAGYDVHLSWSPPDCSGNGFILDQGFEDPQFPPVNWTKSVTNENVTWSHGTPAAYYGVHDGNYSAGLLWDYYHQDEWLIAQDVEITGNLQFWSFAFQGSSHLDHYYVKISIDQGATWDILLDMSALAPYASPSGYNQWNEPYLIDLSAYAGEVADIAWHAVDGDNMGLWYAWAIDDCSIGEKSLTPVAGSRFATGYDIYRQDPGAASFQRINASPVPDTGYIDSSLPAGEYRYYINAMTNACNVITSSDTVVVDVITSAENPEVCPLKLFPNPASNILNISSYIAIREITIFDPTGRVAVAETEPGNEHKVGVDISKLVTGIYIAGILTGEGIIYKKFVIAR